MKPSVKFIPLSSPLFITKMVLENITSVMAMFRGGGTAEHCFQPLHCECTKRGRGLQQKAKLTVIIHVIVVI
jgi:hypothetical protein